MKNKLSPTEKLSNNSKFIDKVSTKEAIELMVSSNIDVMEAINNVKNDIEKIILKIYEKLLKSNKGRLLYVGAGTSGRIGVQDGVELYPTFGWPKNRIGFLIAGGIKALTTSVENAEDDIRTAKNVRSFDINEHDVVIGLAASGDTPFTNEILKEARNFGALTIGLSNNPKGLILKNAELGLLLKTNSELILVRLAKAGTAQKICLNIISSVLMIKMKEKNGQMTHLVPTNQKLRERQRRILMVILVKFRFSYEYFNHWVAGFIGMHLANSLLKDGQIVYGIDNLNDYYDVELKTARIKQLEHFGKNFKFFKLDIIDKKKLVRVFNNYDFEIVIHLAAQAGVRYSLYNPDVYVKSNIEGFLNILQNCKDKKIKHLIYASSSSVYVLI